MAFEKKVERLMSEETENKFLVVALKESNTTVSGNGAKKYATSGNIFVDNFAAISCFKEPRNYTEVSKDMDLLWSQNPLMCLKLAVYIRLVTRKTKVVNGDKVETLDVQRGQGLKNEGTMRMLWLALNQPKTFKANFAYFVAAGSWKDVFNMLSLDLQYHGWKDRKLDWKFFFMVISAGLTNSETTHLVRKYLPTIRTNKNCKTVEAQADTLIGRWLARTLFPTLEKEQSFKSYRKLKSEGLAHKWQQVISQQLYETLNFDTIAGRALALLVGSKFLENHNLVERYTKWIEDRPVAKYTGYVHELFAPFGSDNHAKHLSTYKEMTINKQFESLIEAGKGNINSSLLVVRDTSGSMMSQAMGCNVSSFVIAKSLALYFSEFLTGAFANSFAEFSHKCVLHKWIGNTPVEKYVNDRCTAIGNTDFQSVIDLLISVKNQGVPETEFPKGILCLSDGELDRCSDKATNFQLAIAKLKEAGFSEEYVNNFKLILWDIPNSFYGTHKVKFEDFADAPNFFYLSGYDASAIAFIMGTEAKVEAPKNAEELFEAAMNQTILNSLKIITNKKHK